VGKILKDPPDAKIYAVISTETSTGVRQPFEESGAYHEKIDTRHLVDNVTSLGGCEVKEHVEGRDFMDSRILVDRGFSEKKSKDKFLWEKGCVSLPIRS
jgi:hypothetical protein